MHNQVDLITVQVRSIIKENLPTKILDVCLRTICDQDVGSLDSFTVSALTFL